MSVGDQKRDPVQAMTEMFDSFQNFARRAEKTEDNSVKYRLNLLWIHATAAILIAPLFAAIGKPGMAAPTFALMRQIPGSPASIAIILGVGGFVLGIGCVIRSKRLEIVGLCCLTLWYAIIVLTFAGAVIQWYVDGADPVHIPALYAPVLYLHFAVIMVAHMINLIRTRRVDERYGSLE